MSVRTFARVWGILFLIIGVAGFIPGITQPHTHPDVAVDSFLGLELGLFPVNLLHNIVHLAFGLWGLAASRSWSASRGYARGTAIIYAVFMIMGLVEAGNLHTTFGLVPLYGNDVWLHALLAAVAAYFGWVHRDREHGRA
jgi:hypothetical protein